MQEVSATKQLSEALKISWMILWRLFIVSVLTGFDWTMTQFAFAFIAGFTMSFGAKVGIKTFPVIKLFKRKKVFYRLYATSSDASTASSENPVIFGETVDPHIPSPVTHQQGAPYPSHAPRFARNVQCSNPVRNSPDTPKWYQGSQNNLSTGQIPDDDAISTRVENFDTDRIIEAPVSTPKEGDYTRKHSRASDTGYEPYHLKNVVINSTPMMKGKPGHGLSDAVSSGGISAENAHSGQLGEVNLAKALSITGTDGNIGIDHNENSLLSTVHTYWSVSLPSKHNPAFADTKINTDVDCVLVTGRNIVIIDAKMYRGGNVTYKNTGRDGELVTIGANGYPVGDPYTMSKNVSMALSRFTDHYPAMHVSAMVVLVTPDSGEATVDATWESGIPLMTMSDAMRKLARISESNVNTKPNAYLDRSLTGLLR